MTEAEVQSRITPELVESVDAALKATLNNYGDAVLLKQGQTARVGDVWLREQVYNATVDSENDIPGRIESVMSQVLGDKRFGSDRIPLTFREVDVLPTKTGQFFVSWIVGS